MGIYVATITIGILVLTAVIGGCKKFCENYKKNAELKAEIEKREAYQAGHEYGWNAAADYYVKTLG